MLTQERADIISKYLEADEENAKAVLALDPEQAAAKINQEGYDFTVDEIVAYGNALKLALADGELKDDELDNVAGGVVTVSIGIMAACIAGGFAAGFIVNKKW